MAARAGRARRRSWGVTVICFMFWNGFIETRPRGTSAFSGSFPYMAGGAARGVTGGGVPSRSAHAGAAAAASSSALIASMRARSRWPWTQCDGASGYQRDNERGVNLQVKIRRAV